jgi:NAD(P)-dependent dehydrogenase (short-subunit alcohol dehydrogenase family)
MYWTKTKMKLQEKVAIVTGASSGLGLAIATLYAKEGAKVVLSDVNQEDGEKAAESIGANAAFFKCDVSDFKQVDALVDFAIKTFGSLDIMVNNAGIGGLGGVTDATDEAWNQNKCDCARLHRNRNDQGFSGF